MAYPRNPYSDRYQVTGRDMLAYGHKYGEPWGEDRRALERAFYGIDRKYTSDSGWSPSSARDGRRSHSGSAAGLYRNASNAGDEQSLVDGMKMVKIGAGESHDRDGNRSASNRRSRSDISASSSTAGRVATRSSPSDGHQNNMTSRRSYSTGEKEKSRAAVPAKVGRPGILRTKSSFQSDDNDLRGRNEWFHERDTLHSRSSSSSEDYPSQLERNRSQGYGSYYGHVPFPTPVYDTYRHSQVLPVYGYGPRSESWDGRGHSHNYNANYDGGYDGRSEGSTSSGYSYSASYPRTSGYAESSYLGSIYEDIPERYDVSSECDDYGSCSDFGDYSESDDDYYD